MHGVMLDAFAAALSDWLKRHEGLWDLDEERAAELGRDAAAAAVAPALWAQQVGDRYDTAAVVDLLGVSRQALHKRVANNSLLGIPGKGTTWFPRWQFDIERRQVRPVVAEIVAAFRAALGALDPLLVASWATTEQHEDLEGATPEDWMVARRDDHQLVAAARRAASGLAG